MKSKIRRTSKSTVTKKKAAAPLAAALAIGHEPTVALSPQTEALFRAFQSNLLSLISHELKTPLTGVLNSLAMLDEADDQGTGGLSRGELLRMAKQNAQRLQVALSELLDVAALESGLFHARLREVDLSRIFKAKLAMAQDQLKARRFQLEGLDQIPTAVPLIADPQKLARAIELALQVLLARAEPGGTIQVRISSKQISFSFSLAKDGDAPGGAVWDTAWMQATAGFESGVVSPYSAFAGVVQSEQAFLTRTHEGLGSELLLIHEIMRIHQGRFLAARNDERVAMSLNFPEFSPEQALRMALGSRVSSVSNDLGTVALVLLQSKDEYALEAFLRETKKTLFRSSDAVYAIPEKGWLALILDDCRSEDLPRMVERLEKSLGRSIFFGGAHCPTDGLDPNRLYDLAEERLRRTLK